MKQVLNTTPLRNCFMVSLHGDNWLEKKWDSKEKVLQCIGPCSHCVNCVARSQRLWPTLHYVVVYKGKMSFNRCFSGVTTGALLPPTSFINNVTHSQMRIRGEVSSCLLVSIAAVPSSTSHSPELQSAGSCTNTEQKDRTVPQELTVSTCLRALPHIQIKAG